MSVICTCDTSLSAMNPGASGPCLSWVWVLYAQELQLNGGTATFKTTFKIQHFLVEFKNRRIQNWRPLTQNFHIIQICRFDYEISQLFYLGPNELTTCWVVLTFHHARHEKWCYFFQIKCTVEMFPQRLPLLPYDCCYDWLNQKKLASQ